jgi:APA family basic amino acid/polyamine antiporter
MARDKMFLNKADSIHPTFNTPDVALFIQAIWAIALLFSGSFDQLTDMLIFAAFLFYGCTALGVIIMRIKEPQIERPYKVIGYPFLPVLFFLFCITLFISTIINQPREAIWGIGLMATGIPVYYFLNKEN